MIYYTTTVRALLFIGVSLATLRGGNTPTRAVKPIDPAGTDYRLTAAQMYVENNMPSAYDPFCNKFLRAYELATTQPKLCCLTFFSCILVDQGLNNPRWLRAQYCEQKKRNLLLGKLPVTYRPDVEQIMDAFDDHTTQALRHYMIHDDFEPESWMGSSCQFYLMGGCAYVSQFCVPCCLPLTAIPFCLAAAITNCCLGRSVSLIDQL